MYFIAPYRIDPEVVRRLDPAPMRHDDNNEDDEDDDNNEDDEDDEDDEDEEQGTG